MEKDKERMENSQSNRNDILEKRFGLPYVKANVGDIIVLKNRPKCFGIFRYLVIRKVDYGSYYDVIDEDGKPSRLWEGFIDSVVDHVDMDIIFSKLKVDSDGTT